MPEKKTIDTFDFSFNPKIPKQLIFDLATARFVSQAKGVLFIGPPGVGKSHLAIALTISAISAGYTALHKSAGDLAEAEATGTSKEVIQELLKNRPPGHRGFRHEKTSGNRGRGSSVGLCKAL